MKNPELTDASKKLLINGFGGEEWQCYICGKSSLALRGCVNYCNECGAFHKKRYFSRGYLFPQLELKTQNWNILNMANVGLVVMSGLASEDHISSSASKIACELHGFARYHLQQKILPRSFHTGVHRNVFGKITLWNPDVTWKSFGRRIGKVHFRILETDDLPQGNHDLYESLMCAAKDILNGMQNI